MTVRAMRWYGAVYFAFLPTLFMLVMQANVIYNGRWSGLTTMRPRMLEPVLFCAPLCLIMAATGFAMAARCCTRGIGKVLLLGCAVGACWALLAISAGTLIGQWHGGAPPTPSGFLNKVLVTSAFSMPLGVILCAFTRWRGARLGVARATK